MAFGHGCCVMTCVIRNYSEGGALLDLPNSGTTPSEFELEIVPKQQHVLARMVWRTPERMGIAFSEAKPGVVPIEMARRIRRLEQANDSLRQRLSEFGGTE
jgi:hypothetical protein